MPVNMRTSMSVFLSVCVVFITIARPERGYALKRSSMAQTSSSESKLQSFLHNTEAKLLQSRESLGKTDKNRQGGSTQASDRSEIVQLHENGSQFLALSSKQRNFPISELRSKFVAEYSTYKFRRASSLQNHMKLHQGTVTNASLRHKRHIFPPDNRRRLTNYQASQRFPYSATVKISTGCTGTLISNQHVLTSAHCVHNRTHYITPTNNIRVGFLKSNGMFRWLRVTSTSFHRSQWMNSKGSRYDYAVLTLSRPHKRKFFRLAEPSKSSLHIYFSSFPGDKRSNTLWFVDCSAVVLRQRSTIMSQCDASKGSSGAGVYTLIQRRGKNKRVIIGVLSGATDLIKLPNGGSSQFNIAVSLQAADIRDICRWAGSPRGCPS